MSVDLEKIKTRYRRLLAMSGEEFGQGVQNVQIAG